MRSSRMEKDRNDLKFGIISLKSYLIQCIDIERSFILV